MPLAPRSQFYKFMTRRAYTTSMATTQHQSQLAQILPFLVPAISTLRPEKLVLSDFLAFAGESRPSFHTRLSFHSTLRRTRLGKSTVIGYRSYRFDEPDGATRSVEDDGIANSPCERFPRHAYGFLYLHRPPPKFGLPRSASSIRFRCVPSLVESYFLYGSTHVPANTLISRPKPFTLPLSPTNTEIHEAFKTGYDLTLPNDTPWSIPVILVAGYPSLENVRVQLLEDKLFSESELQEYKDIHYKLTTNVRASLSLDSLDKVFSVRFDTVKFTVVQFKVGVSVFESVFMDERSKYGKVLPYTGAAFARFELVPDKPELCLRIVKIIKPVKCRIPDYDGYIHMPKEGELVTRGLPGESKPWVCRLSPTSRRHSAILRLLPGCAENANSS